VVRGLVLGLVVAVLLAAVGLWWLGWGSDLVARGRARDAMAGFGASAPATADEARAHPGATIGVISIPRLGLTWPVVSGTDHLDRGLGWVPTTGFPGQPGNMAVTGPRLTDGSPLRHFGDLRVDDEIVVRTSTHVFTYTVVVPPSSLTVDRDDTWVLDGVPGHPGAVPTRSVLTIISSQDLLASRERSVGFAVLSGG
jgi:sortase A